jgi:hypothetical protein
MGSLREPVKHRAGQYVNDVILLGLSALVKQRTAFYQTRELY